jgi:hypothetical protein
VAARPKKTFIMSERISQKDMILLLKTKLKQAEQERDKAQLDLELSRKQLIAFQSEKADINAVRFNAAMQFIRILDHETYTFNRSGCHYIKGDFRQYAQWAFREKLKYISKAYAQNERSYLDNEIPEKFQLLQDFIYSKFPIKEIPEDEV